MLVTGGERALTNGLGAPRCKFERKDMSDFRDEWMGIVEAFNKDPTALQYLRDDGEGGFRSGIYRMAREIERLRLKCGEPAERDPAWQDDE
jgi:hypothetical protein